MLTNSEIVSEAFGHLYGKLSRSWDRRTICEVLREIYWYTEDKEIRDRIEEAIVMAMKMSDRLSSYAGSSIWETEMTVPNPFWKEKTAARKAQALAEAKKRLNIE